MRRRYLRSTASHQISPPVISSAAASYRGTPLICDEPTLILGATKQTGEAWSSVRYCRNFSRVQCNEHRLGFLAHGALQQSIFGSVQPCSSRCREVLRMHVDVCMYLLDTVSPARSLMPPPVLQWLHSVSCCTTCLLVHWVRARCMQRVGSSSAFHAIDGKMYTVP